MSERFGTVLKQFRLRRGIGLRRFATMVDMLPSNLSAIEHGRRNPPSDAEKLEEVANALGLVRGSDDWAVFFDAARRSGELPADLSHLAQHDLVPVLLRAIDNRSLGDEEIERLIADINQRPSAEKA
jgi:transcriptional regulator with XRE-family HTH domain